MAVRIRTQRLILRPFEHRDAPAIVRNLSDPRVSGYLTLVPAPYGDADAREWVEANQAPDRDTANLAIANADDDLIGAIGLAEDLGFWLDPAWHGHGLMTEAADALLAWYYSERDGDVVSSAHVGNAASLAVQTKLGFIETGVVAPRFSTPLGREIDHVETLLTHAAFVAAHERLRAG